MAKKFASTVPKKPFLRRETYEIPKTYLAAYNAAGVTNPDEAMMLFHVTQFGGFKIGKMPQDLSFDREFITRWFKYEYEFGCHNCKANAEFLRRFGNIELKPLQRIWRSEAVDIDAMHDGGFSLEEINEALSLLPKLNDFYSSLRLEIPLPNSGISAEDRIKLARFHGIPYLVKKPKAGGRLFHPETSYQRISSALRQIMTINGERTSEIDISAATIQFLNIAIEKHALGSLEEKVLSNGDPYQYFLSILNSPDILLQYQEQDMDREMFKKVLYTAIYSTESRQESQVNRKLRFMGRQYKHSDLVSLFPEFFNALKELRHKTGLPLHMVINKEESGYAQQVLKKGCLEKRLPILPLHDSFIVPESNIDSLKEVMDFVSIKLYGKRLTYKQKY